MKKTTREQCEEVIAARVEWLVTRWQEEKTQEEKKADHKLNERMDHWMKEITKEQREAIEDCIDDMLDGNGMCQLYLYEEGVKDGIRLMKMIRCSLRSSAVAVPFLNGRFPTQNGRSFFNQVT